MKYGLLRGLEIKLHLSDMKTTLKDNFVQNLRSRIDDSDIARLYCLF